MMTVRTFAQRQRRSTTGAVMIRQIFPLESHPRAPAGIEVQWRQIRWRRGPLIFTEPSTIRPVSTT